MTEYSFKKEVSVYAVFSGSIFPIQVNSINFTQRINTEDLIVKTLQKPNNLFSDVIIDEISPASFDLVVYAIRENDYKVLFNRALDCEPFDLYVVTKQDTFYIEHCIITNMQFILDPNQAMALSYKGEAIKVSRPGNAAYSIPGTLVTPSNSTTYNRLKQVEITLGTTTFNRLKEVSIELQNNIKWLYNKYISQCIAGTDLTFPYKYIIENKILAGTFSTNRIGDRRWSTEESLQIIVGDEVVGTVYGFDIDIETVAFTNRETSGNVFSQSFDWRMTQNPDTLFEVIKYVTYSPAVAGAILDYLNQAILDYQDTPILESP